jgi:hypothetical protein
MSKYGNILDTYEINHAQYQELLKIARTIRCSPETEQALIKIAKKLWRYTSNYYIDDKSMVCMIKAGLENRPFSYNYV